MRAAETGAAEARRVAMEAVAVVACREAMAEGSEEAVMGAVTGGVREAMMAMEAVLGVVASVGKVWTTILLVSVEVAER